MKRPSRRDDDEAGEGGGKRRGRRSRREREREQREALARARRERTRKARGGLAEKAKGEDGVGGPDDAGEAAGADDGKRGGAATGRGAAAAPRAPVERPAKAGSEPKAKAADDAEGDTKATTAAGRKEKAKATADRKSRVDAKAEKKLKARADAKAKAAAERKEKAEAERKEKAEAKARTKAGRKARPKDKPQPKTTRGDAAKAGPGARGRRPAAAEGGRRRTLAEPGGRRTGGEGEEKPSRRRAGGTGDGTKRRRSERRSRRGGGRRVGANAKRAGKGALVALKRGATETWSRARRTLPKLGSAAFGLIVGAFAIFFTGLGYALRALIAVYLRVAPPVSAALRLARRALDATSRLLTPARALAVVVAVAALLLALSQFADYRNISIGNDAYAEGLQTVAPAPVRETATTGSAHSYMMVPLVAIALILLGAALTGRWRLCRLIALIGVVAIAVGLIHDRPTGLDIGDAGLAYTGVKATLLGGFYAQLFSGLLLALSALLLGRELKLAGAAHPARASRAWRRLHRRDPRAEGARA